MKISLADPPLPRFRVLKTVILSLALLMLTFSSASATGTGGGPTGSTTHGFDANGGVDYVMHFDEATGHTERIDLEIGTPSSNTTYVGNYRYNNQKRRNLWRWIAPHLSSGVLRLWDQGWTGKGVTVYIQDTWYRGTRYPSHGEIIESIIKGGTIYVDGQFFTVPGIAPEVTVVRPQDNPNLYEVDIWNQSTIAAQNGIRTDSLVDAHIAYGENMREKAFWLDILVTKGAGNSYFDSCHSFAYCNQHAVGLTGYWDPIRNEFERDPYNTTIVAGLRDYGTPGGVLARDYLKVNHTLYATSGATAVVSGAAALLKQKYPNLGARQLKILLLESAIGKGVCQDESRTVSCIDPVWGHGMLNMRSAMSPVSRLQPDR